MFLGSNQVAIDPKGRINIPARFREVLEAEYGNTLIVSIHDKCLVSYPVKEWEAKEEMFKSLPQTEKTQNLLRHIYSRIAECPLKNGRILIPGPLRNYAALKKDVVLVGISKKIEIWDKARWDEFISGQPADELSDELAKFGL